VKPRARTHDQLERWSRFSVAERERDPSLQGNGDVVRAGLQGSGANRHQVLIALELVAEPLRPAFAGVREVRVGVRIVGDRVDLGGPILDDLHLFRRNQPEVGRHPDRALQIFVERVQSFRQRARDRLWYSNVRRRMRAKLRIRLGRFLAVVATIAGITTVAAFSRRAAGARRFTPVGGSSTQRRVLAAPARTRLARRPAVAASALRRTFTRATFTCAFTGRPRARVARPALRARLVAATRSDAQRTDNRESINVVNQLHAPHPRNNHGREASDIFRGKGSAMDLIACRARTLG
jgi:hypothetical protein